MKTLYNGLIALALLLVCLALGKVSVFIAIFGGIIFGTAALILLITALVTLADDKTTKKALEATDHLVHWTYGPGELDGFLGGVKLKPGKKGDAYIGRTAASFNSERIWWDTGWNLQLAELKPGSPAVVELTIEAQNHHANNAGIQEAGATFSKTLRIPVPRGEETEAERVVRMLGGSPPVNSPVNPRADGDFYMRMAADSEAQGEYSGAKAIYGMAAEAYASGNLSEAVAAANARVSAMSQKEAESLTDNG